jgi:importin-5
MLKHYLIAWANICQTMGPEFELYLPMVMPLLLSAAGT